MQDIFHFYLQFDIFHLFDALVPLNSLLYFQQFWDITQFFIAEGFFSKHPLYDIYYISIVNISVKSVP